MAFELKKFTEKIKDKKYTISALLEIGTSYKTQGRYDSTIYYYNTAHDLALKLKNKKIIANTLNHLAIIDDLKSDYKLALEKWGKCMEIYEELNDSSGISNTLSNMATIEVNFNGNLSKGIEYLNRAIDIKKKNGDKRGLAITLYSLGKIYQNNKYFNLALEIYKESDILCDEISYDGLKVALLNEKGLVYASKKDTALALISHHKQYDIAEKINQKLMMGVALGNISNLQTNPNEKIATAKRALEIYNEIEWKDGMAGVYNNLANTYFAENKIDEAIINGEKGLEIAKKIQHLERMKELHLILFKCYEKKKNLFFAIENYKEYIILKDSINNEENQKAIIHQQVKYEYEKVQVIKNKEYEKQLAVEQEAKAKQKVIIISIAGGLGLVAIFLFFVMNKLKITRQQKAVIEQQKEVLEKAHHELEEKNQEIMDSITYAKRIQSAILPPAKLVKEYLKESFILYKPKDVVAGDFYWMEHKDGKVLFAAADCTGHGVPGAMVSVVCNNALNRSVREHGLTNPGEILNKAREIVVQEFEKSDEKVKDGMDIALCSLEGNKLQYAGANNPLWIIRKGEIIETSANKQPIGQFENPEPYSTHTFELQKGDSFYIFSDGYVDQFGGEKGKKFKARAFRELLLSIQNKSMEEQKTITEEVFETWKGNLEQIDDVCLIGVRV
jgi:serine phosphatase RsbU (regulator of sigma subunit)